MHFLGRVPRAQIDALCLDAAAIALPAFDLVIDDCGWWQKTGIFWLGPAHSPPALLELARQLAAIATRRQLTAEPRRYVPHLTLLRSVQSPPQGVLVKPFAWQAREFCLMQSESTPTGVMYHTLECWPLQQA